MDTPQQQPPGETPPKPEQPLRRLLWKTWILIAGTFVVLLGIAMIPLPGPGFPVVFGGISILALEFAWAAYLLRKIRQSAGDTVKLIDQHGGRRHRKRLTLNVGKLWRFFAGRRKPGTGTVS